MNVALVFNLIREDMFKDKPIDITAEYDSQETIDALKNAIESGGHKVILLEFDHDIYNKLKDNKNKIDIVFNIAEGMDAESRESFIPLICEILGIPYTGSGPLTLGICLDKGRTKETLNCYKIPTPKFQVINSMKDKISKKLKFPLILKLVGEGSSIGLSYDSVVYNGEQLKKKVEYLFGRYDKPIMLEEYIDGREFTIPIIGNDPPLVLPIIEVIFDKVPEGKPNINIFVPDDPIIELIKNAKRVDEINEMNHSSICPANLEKELETKMKKLAVKAYKALGCKDWCRMEFRVDKNNKPFLLELNPIAGIDPSYYFPRSARVYGLDYNPLINKILNFAIERYKIKDKNNCRS